MPYRHVSVSKLTTGSVLAEPVFNAQLTKLLGSGHALDERLIQRLAQFGITAVAVEQPENLVAKQPGKTMPARSSVHLNVSSHHAHPVAHNCDCGTSITIPPPTPDSRVAAWACQTCGAVYFGAVDEAQSHELRGVALLTASDRIIELTGNEKQADSISPRHTQTFVRSPLAGAYTGPDRRRQKRFPVMIPVVAIPLARDFQVAGDGVSMMTRNISRGGVSLAYTRFSECPYFALDFTPAGIELLQVVLNVRRVGIAGCRYELAGTFINRLVRAPSDCSLQPGTSLAAEYQTVRRTG